MIEIGPDGAELTPDELRRRGVRRALEADLALARSEPRAPREARRALGELVDAFLHDRRRNAVLYKRAHQLGERLSRSGSCEWQPGTEHYTLRCPIYALHRKVAHSVAMTVTTACSVCGAEALGCDHIPGEIYGDEICGSVVTSIGPPGHIAFTAEPDFVYTWHQEQRVPSARLLQQGVISEIGQPAPCRHCQDCSGWPGPGDLDPVGRFKQLVAENTFDPASV